MAVLGARAQTEDAMRALMLVLKNGAQLAHATGALMRSLQQLDPEIRLAVANSFWLSKVALLSGVPAGAWPPV